MPDTNDIEREFKRKVSDQLTLEPEGLDRYIVNTPLTFEDGDRLSIVLKKEGDDWVLTDEGHTFMQLSYDLDESDLQDGNREEIIGRTLLASRVQNRQGELILPIEGELFGDSLYNFVQALIKIDDIRFLSRQRVRSTFIDDFKRLVERIVPETRRAYRWHDPDKDPEKKYEVDYKLNGTETPLFVFALDTNDKVRDATITLGAFERWGLKYKSLGVFEDEEAINRKVLARFLDMGVQAFSSLSATEDRFKRTFPEFVKDTVPAKT
jgi:Domain of unknown function DUF1828